jgi:diguanylate cyclase (GGDEF)-like protein/PAS domain S-box-containing protein
LVLAAAAYWALAKAGLRFGTLPHPYVSPVWPSAGFALALILVHGYRFWPAIFIGALAVNLEAGASLPVSAGIAAANALSSLFAAYVLRRFADFQPQLVRLRDVVSLILVGALACRALTATVGTGALWFGGMVPTGEFWTLWLNRWVGGAVGVLVVTPFFLAFAEPIGRSRGAKWYAEALILVVILAAAGAYVFMPLELMDYAHYPLAFVPLPFVIWAAMRFEVRGASVASLLLALVSLLGTLQGHGPFADLPPHEAVLLLAIYNGMVAATGLLVAGAVSELRRERSLRSSLDVLRQVFDLLPVGVWITDERGRISASNPAGRRIWGGERQVEPKEYGEYKGWRLPGRTPIEAHDWALARAVEKGESHVGEEIEIEGFDGERRVIKNSAMPLRDGGSRIVGAIAVNEDITELIRRDQHLRELAEIVEQTDDMVVVTDRTGVIEYVNPAFERGTGYRPDEAIGKTPAILKSGEHDHAFYRDLWGTIRSGRAFRNVVCNRNRAGELYYEAKTISPVRDTHGEITHFVSTGKDITERIRAEEHIKRLARARGVMAECNRVLVHATDETQMLADMCRIAVELGGYRMAWIGYAEHDEAKSVRPVAQAGMSAAYVEAARISWADTERGRGPTGTAIRTGQASRFSDLLADPRFAAWRDRSAQDGSRSALALPLSNGTGRIGALSIYAAEPDAFDAEEIALLQELADDIAFGIDALRARVQRERGERLLQTLVEGTAAATGAEFMRSMVKSLAGALHVRYAFVGRLVGSGARVSTVALWAGDGFGENFDYELAGTPCSEVVGRSLCHFPERVQQRFPEAPFLVPLGVESFTGVPVCDSAGRPTGLLVVMDDKPMPQSREAESVLAIFAARAGAELERLDAEQALLQLNERLDATLHAIPDLLFELDENGCYHEVWAHDETLLAAQRERLLGHTVSEMLPPEAAEVVIDALRVAAETGASQGQSIRLLLPQGEFWFELSTARKAGKPGEPLHFIMLSRDVTARKQAEIALGQSEELFRQLATNIPEIFWVREVESDTVLYVSPSWQSVTGWPMPTDRQGLLDVVHADDYRRVLNEAESAPEGGADHEYRITHADGSIRWLHVRTFPVRDQDGKVYRVAGMTEDITAKKAAEERLLKLAHYDSLTNLPNRNLFFESLKRLLAQAQENQWTVGVLFLDLDRFKLVNDTLGHATGDELLQHVARRLVQCVRIRDVVGRLGGDEFALILPALDSPDDAAEVAAKVIQAFAEPFDLAGHETFISASIGITVYPGDANEAEALLRYADAAMYRAKAGGRNTYRYYTAEMNERAMEKLDLETALRRALERREFLLHFQPKLDLESGKVSGVEALLRWQRPEIGLVSPADFIPLLEETGLIVPVGEWVIRAACRQINAWEQEGVAPVPIAINLSGRQFHQKTLAALIAQIAREHGVEPRLLEFEITESSVMANAEETVRILEELQTAGISISVDDFGTGYSSLAYLKRFPIDAVKIDRSFVSDIVANPDDAAIVLAVIGMAHAMELRVIAEGVETEAQLQFLRVNACDEIQGYFFSRPLGSPAVTAFLRERQRAT